jgi:hypothetical protein
MENISRSPIFRDFVTFLTEGSMQEVMSRLHSFRVQEYRIPSPPSIKRNVLSESLSQGSQNLREDIYIEHRAGKVARLASWRKMTQPGEFCW